MAEPSEKLANSLEILKALQDEGRVAIRSRDLTRTHRERLLKNGFLKEVIRGWYVPSRPDEAQGESTAWYASYWDFLKDYLTERYGTDWSLSPEQSLLLHAGNRAVPRQLLIRSPKGSNNTTDFPFETSLVDVRQDTPKNADMTERDGLRLYALDAGLVSASPNFFRQYPNEARALLAALPDTSRLLARLLDGGHSAIAGRLAGALRSIGRERAADEIVKAMRAADYDVREADPFEQRIEIGGGKRAESPYVLRLQLMWEAMRQDVIDIFPAAAPVNDAKAYLERVEEIYVTDAYHSLSIEGYQVSVELIERVRSGDWNPDTIESDREHRNALAARGYYQAFQEVKKSVARVLEGGDAAELADAAHSDWYRELFTPSVTAGLIKPSDLAGYRGTQVYIRRSRYTPPPYEEMREAMPALFDLLRREESAAVRVVLGHFVFVYIHPYVDGNGRIGRFLMNLMMAAAGVPWTVVPVERRADYMSALEAASVEQDIRPFAALLTELAKSSVDRPAK